MAMINKDEAYQGVRQYHINMVEGDVGEYVILPGDPFRTDIIAKYFDNPVMVMHNREHKTWTGTYKGIKVSVTSTGMGCPSTAIALEELANIGGKVFIRLGTCAGFRDDVHMGDICVTTADYKCDGTSRRYVPDTFPAVPDLDLTYELVKTSYDLCKDNPERVKTGVTASDDAFYAEDFAWIEHMHDLGVMNCEMESSAIYTIGHKRNLRCGTVCSCAANLYTGEDIIGEKNPYAADGIELATQIILETFYRYDQKRKEGTLLKPLEQR